jgi:hypothetical protein
MAVLDPTAFDPGELAAMLAAWAEGYYPSEAAVGLLTHGAGGQWLRRRDFLTACVEAVDDGWSREGAVPMAVIDWDAVEAFLAGGAAASSGELSVLRAAASLAGANAGSLCEVTASLDVTNLGHVLDAIAHRSGWHEHGFTRTVTGQQSPAGIVDGAGGLPTWEDIRARTYGVLGDAEDWLRSDWRPGTGPSTAASKARLQAFQAIAVAKERLNAAAQAERGRR